MIIFRWIAKLFKRHQTDGNGKAAHRARVEAESRLAYAKSMWPQTRETHDLLAAMIEDALRGHR